MLLTAYLIYIFLSLAITIWVANTLHKNGRAFLIDAFKENNDLADSVNHLLVVGFYLINLGYMSFQLKLNISPEDWPHLVELLSAKVGVILLVLGCMHFFNIYIFSQLRKNGILSAKFIK